MKHLHNEEAIVLGKYKKMTAHEKLMEELRAINLAPKLSLKQDEAINVWNAELKNLSMKKKLYFILNVSFLRNFYC